MTMKNRWVFDFHKDEFQLSISVLRNENIFAYFCKTIQGLIKIAEIQDLTEPMSNITQLTLVLCTDNLVLI